MLSSLKSAGAQILKTSKSGFGHTCHSSVTSTDDELPAMNFSNVGNTWLGMSYILAEPSMSRTSAKSTGQASTFEPIIVTSMIFKGRGS